MAMQINVRCPGCQGGMVPTELSCPACEAVVRGKFLVNEFATLPEEELHFLRIFILTEGRIREMESALGVSYPTIKARLAKLKASLAAQAEATAPEQPPAEGEAAGILRALQGGKISYEQAVAELQKVQPKEDRHEN